MSNPDKSVEGARNRAAVREFFRTHVGATQADCAEALGLSPVSVHRHIKALREEWKPRRLSIKRRLR